MRTQALALTVAFAALAIVLNTIRVPTFYWPNMWYRLYEIPIVIAFLLFGPRIGISVVALHLLGQEIFFPLGPVGFVAYPNGAVAILVMLLGTHLATMFIKHKEKAGEPLTGKKQILLVTAMSIAVRGGIMPFIDYEFNRFLFPLVLGPGIFTDAFVNSLIPAFVLFNVTVPLYTIPISYLIAKRVSRNLKLGTNP